MPGKDVVLTMYTKSIHPCYLRVDVTKRKRGVVLVDDLGWDLLGDDLVKDGWCTRISSTVRWRADARHKKAGSS